IWFTVAYALFMVTGLLVRTVTMKSAYATVNQMNGGPAGWALPAAVATTASTASAQNAGSGNRRRNPTGTAIAAASSSRDDSVTTSWTSVATPDKPSRPP